jgi:hypothetical protein
MPILYELNALSVQLPNRLQGKATPVNILKTQVAAVLQIRIETLITQQICSVVSPCMVSPSVFIM